MHVDVAGRRCYVTFKLIRVRQVIRPMTSETSRTAEGSDENVRNVIRHCLEFAPEYPYHDVYTDTFIFFLQSLCKILLMNVHNFLNTPSISLQVNTHNQNE